MKLSISNIAWDMENDNVIYDIMKKYGFEGLEIAPTRVFPEAPYNNIEKASCWSKQLNEKNGLTISSMQSIWFGRTESIFGSDEERNYLIDYTKKAIDFASAIGCGNLVFGCPRNRNVPEGKNPDSAIEFFKEISEYALEKNTAIGMEANPSIYNTNYINTTEQAFELIEKVNSQGFRLNLDIGTMIYNGESADVIRNRVNLINHVHISEPYLKLISVRSLHNQVFDILSSENYNKFVSIEMSRVDDLIDVEKVIKYLFEIK